MVPSANTTTAVLGTGIVPWSVSTATIRRGLPAPSVMRRIDVATRNDHESLLEIVSGGFALGEAARPQ